MKVPKFHYRPDLNELHLDSDPGPLRPDEETKLKEAELLVAKANKKTVGQLTKLKNWAQPKRKELNTGGYIDKEQRLYESLKVPGYETPEKSNASYKKLKEMEKPVTSKDWSKDNDRWRKHLADNISQDKQTIFYNKNRGKWIDKWGQERTSQEALKEQQEIDQVYRDIAPNMMMAKDISPTGLGNKSMKTDPRTPVQKKRDNFKKNNKKFISDAEIQRRLDKLRGPSDWDMIYKGMTPIEKGQWNAEKRKKGMNGKTGEPLVKQFRSDDPSTYLSHPEQQKGMLLATIDDAKKKSKPPQYPEVVLAPEVSRKIINKDERPVEQIVQDLANKRLVQEQRNWDHRYGRGGIPSLKRPD